MIGRWIEKQLEGVFYTFLEIFLAIGLRRLAPFLASILFIALAALVLLVLLDALALAADGAKIWGISQAPRSIAGVAILGGYYVWNNFASAERVGLLHAFHSNTTPARRFRRRLKVAALVALLVAAYLSLTHDDYEVPTQSDKYPGYAWPLAEGCTQIAENLPEFAEGTRLRPDGSRRSHLGIDIVPPASDAHVYVAKDGVVTASSPKRGNGWGNYVIVRHDDGLSTVYAHLFVPSLLRTGDKVRQGDLVGTAGQTETYFVHLHFEVHEKEAGDDWTKGRLNPRIVVGDLDDCRNSAAPAR
jgi:murein DD-endopeptidase MepM/ murein hydrolase activator NlpD